MADPLGPPPCYADRVEVQDLIKRIVTQNILDGEEELLRGAPKWLRRNLVAGNTLGAALEVYGVRPFLLELARERESSLGGHRLLRLLVAPGRELHGVTRMLPHQLARLIAEISPHIHHKSGKRSYSLSPEEQVLIYLIHVTQGGFAACAGSSSSDARFTAASYRDLLSQFQTNIRQVSSVVKRVHEVIVTTLGPRYLTWGRRRALEARRALHAARTGVNGILGYIDGTHLPIRVTSPKEHKEAVNRKGWHSTVAQAVVDCDGRFLDVVGGFFGNCSDRYVFNASPVGKTLRANQRRVLLPGTVIVGDAAYSGIPGIVVPYPPPLTPAQVRFNAWLSGHRQAVEAAFGASVASAASRAYLTIRRAPQGHVPRPAGERVSRG